MALAFVVSAAFAVGAADAKTTSPAPPAVATGPQPLAIDLGLAQEIFPNGSVTGTLGGAAPRYFKVFANRSLAAPETLTITLEATGSLFGAGSLSVFDPEQVLLDEVFTRNPGDINVSTFIVPETGYYLLELLSATSYTWAVTVNWSAGALFPNDNDNDLGNATVLAAPSGVILGNVTETLDLGDLFAINLTASPPRGDALLINLTSGFTADLDVYIYHLEGGLAVIDGLSTSPYGTEFAAAFPGASQTYYVRVMSYAGSSTYVMQWAVLSVVADDNGVPSKATPASSGTFLNNLSRWDTRDLFAFNVPANTSINVSLHTFLFNATAWAPDLQAVFWNETFARVSWSFTFDPDERINVEVSDAGLYYLDLFIADWSYYLNTNLSFGYSMAVSIDTPPAFADPAWNLTVPEDNPAVVDLRTIIPGDSPSEPLSFTLEAVSGQVAPSLGADGRTLTVSPAPDWSGAAVVRLTVSDRWRSETIELPFTFTAVNDPPRLAQGASVFAFDEDTNQLLALASTVVDPEGDPWVLVDLAAAAPLQATPRPGFVDLVPAPDANGNFWLNLSVQDVFGAMANLTITVTVRPVNDAPRFVAAPVELVLAEDASAVEATFDLAGAAVDPDGDAVAYGLAAPYTIAWLFLGTNLTLYPARDFSGSVLARLTASDGALESSAPMTIIVLPVDDAPIVQVPPGQLVGRENETFLYTAEATDIDTPPASLLFAFSLDGAPASAPQSDRTFAHLFSFDDAGFHVLRVTASDGTYSASADLTVFVSETNRPPLAQILSPRGESLPRGALVTFSGRAIDPDGTPVNITWIVDGTQSSSLASFSLEGLAPGAHTVELRVSDGALIASDSSSFEVQGGLPGFGFESALAAIAAAAFIAAAGRRR